MITATSSHQAGRYGGAAGLQHRAWPDEQTAQASRGTHMPARTRIDHRQGNRRRTLALVEIRCGDDQWAAGLVHNISPDGMFVVTESVPAVNSCVDINVVLCMAADVPLRLAGLVVHRSSSGFGMMFGELDGGARAFVEKCLG
jgi:hypothetical protein